MLFITGFGIAGWVYFEFFYKTLASNYVYKVTKIKKEDDVFKLSLAPQGRVMSYKPGQYAYLSFIEGSVSKEIHPFTITSHPSEKELKFAIKILGDYTAALDRLKTGDTARIWGPYGSFAESFFSSRIWVPGYL